MLGEFCWDGKEEDVDLPIFIPRPHFAMVNLDQSVGLSRCDDFCVELDQ